MDVGDAARDPALFAALVDRYKQQTATLQAEINNLYHPLMVANELRYQSGEILAEIDLWNETGAQSGVQTLFDAYAASHTPAFDRMGGIDPSWGGLLDIDPLLNYEERATIVAREDTLHIQRTVLFEYLNQLDASPKYHHELEWDAWVPAPLSRGSFARPPAFEVIHMLDIDPDPAVEDMREVKRRRADATMEILGNPHGPMEWIPVELYWDEFNERDCAYQLMLAGGGRDVIWSAFEQGMPYGGYHGNHIAARKHASQ